MVVLISIVRPWLGSIGIWTLGMLMLSMCWTLCELARCRTVLGRDLVVACVLVRRMTRCRHPPCPIVARLNTLWMPRTLSLCILSRLCSTLG